MVNSSHSPSAGRLRASTTVHLASLGHTALTSPAARLDHVRLIDDALDLLEGEPAFRQFTMVGGAAALESYLSLRPEHYERVERAVRHRRLIAGPWYVDPVRPFPDPEITLRNLHLGTWTCRIFGRAASAAYLPGGAPADLPAYLPQLLRGFGIDALIVDAAEGEPLEGYLAGDDGTRIAFGSALTLPDDGGLAALRLRYGDNPSRSALVIRPWTLDAPRDRRLAFVQGLGRIAGLAQDEIVHSSPEGYAWALRWLESSPTPPPTITPRGAAATPASLARTARLLVEAAEPLAARAEDRPPRPDEPFIRRPQAILRRAWLSLLHGLAVVGENVAEGERLAREADGLARVLVARLGGAPDFGAQFEAVVTASDGFRILAAKLPEDPARRGLVVRGLNPGDGPAQVAVRPWRRFALAHVLGLDETPTGG
ncbi:MAG: hypothetical protein IT323_09580, partial [Anaerolineae bacterium]|nr:hypothetical protein [Anaerolineae bacterium]